MGAVRGEALVMDGRRLRDEMVTDLRAAISAAGDPLVRLATVIVADDELSRTQVGYKHEAAERAGIGTLPVELPADASQQGVEDAVASLAADATVDGVFVQLPLPDHIDPAAVMELVPLEKDIDGLTERSLGRVVAGRPGHVPATPAAVLRLLDRYERPVAGRRAVVLGRSPEVGLPIALLLVRRGAAITITDADHEPDELAALCREADLVVSTLGRAHGVSADWIRPGATVVDIGVTRTEDGPVGDVDPAVGRVAGAVVPNPGGIGPATVACLLQHTFDAARLRGRFA